MVDVTSGGGHIATIAIAKIYFCSIQVEKPSKPHNTYTHEYVMRGKGEGREKGGRGHHNTYTHESFLW